MALDIVAGDLHAQAQHPLPRLRSVELFSGAGGLALATHRAGFQHEQLLERDPDACKTLEANIKAVAEPGIELWQIEQADARKVRLAYSPDLDLIAGGAACQPFSIAGAHAGRNDSRNLLPEFVRSVRASAPRAFLLENVDGLLRPGFADYFDYVKRQLEHPTNVRRPREQWRTHYARLQSVRRTTGLSYRVQHARLNAADFGIPQVRQRVFVVGIRSDVSGHFSFPAQTHSVDRLLHDQWISGAYWEQHELAKPPATPSRWTARLAGLMDAIPEGRPWVTVRDSIGSLPAPSDPPPQRFPQHVSRSGARTYAGHNGSDADWPSKTIKAGNHGVPGGENMFRDRDGTVRYYTVREMARIQTFPDPWVFEGNWVAVTRQLGNAVPVLLGQVVAESVAACLRANL